MLRSRLYPHSDEGFFSYAVRLAKENGYEKYDYLYQNAALRLNRDNLNILLREDIEKNGLVKILGTNINQQLNYMIQDTISKKRIYNVEIYGEIFPYYLIDKKPKLCSICMSSNSYIRNVWQMTPIVCCHIHQCYLVERCPVCNKQYQWKKELLDGCPNCSSSWKVTSERAEVVLEDMFLSDLFYSKLGMMPRPINKKYPNEICNLNLINLVSLLSLTAWVMPKEKAFWNMNHFTQENSVQTYRLLIEALQVYKHWPNKFYAFLSQIQEEKNYYSKKSGKHNKDNSPGIYRSAFGDYYKKLYDDLIDEYFNFVRDAFEIYMVEHRKNSYVKQYQKINFDKLPKVYYSGFDVLHKYGIGNEKFKRYIHLGLFEGFETISNKKKVMLATKKSVDGFMERYYKSLNSFDAATKVGVYDVHLLIDLFKADHIKAVRGPEVDGFGHWRFDPDSLDHLLELIECSVVIKEEVPSQVVSFNKASRSIEGRYYPSYSELITKVKEGILHPCGIDDSAIGLNKFLFTKPDIYAAFKEELACIKNEVYSLTEASTLLMMSRNRLNVLVKQGYIEHKVEKNGYIKIAQQALEKFKEAYITLGEIQKITGKNGTSLLTILKKRDFTPVYGMEYGEGQYLFIRTIELLKFINQIPHK